METDRAFAALCSPPKYRGVCPGALERVYAESLRRYGPKGAEKAARAELHRIAGAFLSPSDLKKASTLLEAAKSGEEGALTQVLALHASTRERLPIMAELYGRALPALGNPRSIADLACGLNPLYLGSLGLRVRGVELSMDAARLANGWAETLGWDVRVEPGDLAGGAPLPEADATLAMKLWPLLDKQMVGGGRALLERVRSNRALVTFPTRSLSGRNVGMRTHYETSFEQNLPADAKIVDKFALPGELCYVLSLDRR
jgi:16S rRNA (guanine(1405)-N(7))-methyltransferase